MVSVCVFYFVFFVIECYCLNLNWCLDVYMVVECCECVLMLILLLWRLFMLIVKLIYVWKCYLVLCMVFGERDRIWCFLYLKV